MFKEGSYVTANGTFQVKAVGEEYIEFDPYGVGEVSNVSQYEENGFKEVT